MNKKQKGFTLIELMIVLAIIGLLAAIALPSYTKQVQQSRRSDVMDMLTDCAAAQARNFTTATPPVYLDQPGLVNAQLCNSSSGAPTSKDGHYQITAVNNVNCAVNDGQGAAVGFWCFQLVATAVAGGVQANDNTCTTWTIDHRGVTTATDGPNNTGNNTTDQCWRS